MLYVADRSETDLSSARFDSDFRFGRYTAKWHTRVTGERRAIWEHSVFVVVEVLEEVQSSGMPLVTLC